MSFRAQSRWARHLHQGQTGQRAARRNLLFSCVLEKIFLIKYAKYHNVPNLRRQEHQASEESLERDGPWSSLYCP